MGSRECETDSGLLRDQEVTFGKGQMEIRSQLVSTLAALQRKRGLVSFQRGSLKHSNGQIKNEG
jgi:hypothetical protein